VPISRPATGAATAAAIVSGRKLRPVTGGENMETSASLAWPGAAMVGATGLLGPITRSAADLLTSPAPGRLKQCPGSPNRTCGFLFLDQTKNHSRRWCSSSTCGNRTRLHRHSTHSGAYQRKAATSGYHAGPPPSSWES